MQRAEEAERQRLDAELAARTAASAAQLAQIEEQQKQIEAQARALTLIRLLLHCPARHVGQRVCGYICTGVVRVLLQLSRHCKRSESCHSPAFVCLYRPHAIRQKCVRVAGGAWRVSRAGGAAGAAGGPARRAAAPAGGCSGGRRGGEL